MKTPTGHYWKIYLLLSSISKFAQIFAKASSKLEFFKATRKKWALIFSKEGSKERKGKTEEKVSYFNLIFVNFRGKTETWSFTCNISLKKYLVKVEKNKNFTKGFVVIWFVLCSQNIKDWFSDFLWQKNCRKCRNHHTLNLYSKIMFSLCFKVSL